MSLFEKKKGKYASYLEKGNRFEKIFDPIENGSDKDNRLETFASFFEDDPRSISYIRDVNFDFKFKEIDELMQKINRKSNFKELI